MQYDFVLLENLYTVENHYKDLTILARLLKEADYTVAIADVFKEASLCKVDGIPHLSLGIKSPTAFSTLHPYDQNHSRWKNLYRRIIKDFYLYRIILRLKGIASHVYLGSMTLDTPAFFFSAFERNTKYYMWALRSAALLYWKKGHIDLYYFVSKSLYNRSRNIHNLNLIVSNDIIKREFETNVGIESSRIITRPERIIENEISLNKKEKRTNQILSLLYIGTIRPSKNIGFCLEALKRLKDDRIVYTIAGRCREDKLYGDEINKKASETPNAIRIDRYIPDEEYERLINDCDFVVLCDEKETSCASNGTMSEALLHGKPIIAPDINPFRNEVETYGIGYLYEYGNIDSLCEVLQKALSGRDVFVEKLEEYQNGFILRNVALNLRRQIDQMK